MHSAQDRPELTPSPFLETREMYQGVTEADFFTKCRQLMPPLITKDYYLLKNELSDDGYQRIGYCGPP
jgi:hypothetical protein